MRPFNRGRGADSSADDWAGLVRQSLAPSDLDTVRFVPDEPGYTGSPPDTFVLVGGHAYGHLVEELAYQVPNGVLRLFMKGWDIQRGIPPG